MAKLDQSRQGTVWIYANSVPGSNTNFYTYVSPDNVNWYLTKQQTLNGNNNRVWVNCGAHNGNVLYVSIAVLHNGASTANINIDAIIIA
ncbi:MAG: hypothetical protein FWD52_05520 [Candidatus Bathyarchaeota archaeon]|nr:hypothetical protein [Candidatus Termiticorpusculum sp.]